MHTSDNTTNKIITVICEGPSEVAYLSELNKMLREEKIKISFVIKKASNGHFTSISKLYKSEIKKNRKPGKIIIVVDYDTYKRNDSKNGDKYGSKGNIPDFLFNYNNFEDFIILHLPNEIVLKWQGVCRDLNHFENPLVAEKYEPLFKKHVFSNYGKGNFPLDNFDLEMLKRAIKNNKDDKILFKSDFLTFLEKIL